MGIKSTVRLTREQAEDLVVSQRVRAFEEGLRFDLARWPEKLLEDYLDAFPASPFDNYLITDEPND